MKHFIVGAVALLSSAALAHGPGGGFHGARPVHFGGHPPARVVVHVPRPVVYAPRPVFVGPRRWVTGPRFITPRPAFVATLPVGAVQLTIGATPYVVAGGAYYVPASNGYAVTAAPLGSWVPSLPGDAYISVINGITYAQWQGAWFQWDVTRGGWLVSVAP